MIISSIQDLEQSSRGPAFKKGFEVQLHHEFILQDISAFYRSAIIIDYQNTLVCTVHSDKSARF